MGKPNNVVSETDLYKHRKELEACNFGFKKKFTIRVAKTKALISFAVTEADLRLCFRICRLLVFSRGGSFVLTSTIFQSC